MNYHLSQRLIVLFVASTATIVAALACSTATDEIYRQGVHPQLSTLVSCDDPRPSPDMECCGGYWRDSYAASRRLAKVVMDVDGEERLAYSCYENEPSRLQDTSGAPAISDTLNRLPDFSHAGYRGGGVALPEVTACDDLNAGHPNRCGLIFPGDPNDPTEDDAQRIEDWIDSGSCTGQRNVICLVPGTYNLRSKLRIKRSNIVLHGAGQHRGGTILLSHIPTAHRLVQVRGTPDTSEVSNRWALAEDVGVGATSIEVSGSPDIVQGDWIAILRTPNSEWIEDVRARAEDFGGEQSDAWTAADMVGVHHRQVSQVSYIDGDKARIGFQVPMVEAIYELYGGGAVAKINHEGYVEEVGVENLLIDSVYHDDKTDDDKWSGIFIEGTRNSWVRDVTVKNYSYSAVEIRGNSYHLTIQDTAHLDPISPFYRAGTDPKVMCTMEEAQEEDAHREDYCIPRSPHRYSFNITSQSYGILFQRCYARNSRHTFVTGKLVAGPNVWLDSLTEHAWSVTGPHERWATGLLFDNIVDVGPASRAIRNGHDKYGLEAVYHGGGHGWRGAQTMYWNSAADAVRVYSPPGARNWLVGGIVDDYSTVLGALDPRYEVNDIPWGIKEHNHTTVTPRSLYLQQLKDRLGQQAVNDVTLPAQREGRIAEAIRQWAGDGRLEDHVKAVYENHSICDGRLPANVKTTCCEHGCPQCGGSGCGEFGADKCCGGNIKQARQSCRDSSGPCVMPDPQCKFGHLVGKYCCEDLPCTIAERAQIKDSCYDFPAPCIIPDPECDRGTLVSSGGRTYCCEKSTPCSWATRLCIENAAPCLMADPECTLGVPSKVACCEAGCDQCGGVGCTQSGMDCCHSEIVDSCDDTMASCLLP